MKHLIINNLDIDSDEIHSEVIRVKALLINRKNEILVGYSDNCYQFIGGHKNDEETYVECLNREVLEETGIDLNICNMEPVFLMEHYCNDWPENLDYVDCKIYYFVIKTDEVFDISKTNYTEDEEKGNFKLQYINISNLKQIIIDNYKKYNNAKVIGEEMIIAIDKIFEGNYESFNY